MEPVDVWTDLVPYWEQKILPGACKRFAATDLLCPYNTGPLRLPSGVRLILVVHDLIYLEPWRRLPPSASLYQTFGRAYRRWVVPRVIQRAHRIVTVSESTRAAITRQFGALDNRITVIPNSVPDGRVASVALPMNSRSNEILTVTGSAPHKNLPTLLHAYAILRSHLSDRPPIPTLRIVGINAGQQRHFERVARQHGVHSAVRFEPYLSPDELFSLYSSAALFVFPSLLEGFGIPLIEAMAAGTPVACSSSSALPELTKDSAWLFDPRDARHMASVLLDAWLDLSKRQRCADEGLKAVQKYRSSVVTRQVETFWETLQ